MGGGHPGLPALIAILVPLGFAALWLGVTRLLAVMAGWPALEQAYPNRDDIAGRRFRWQSAVLQTRGRPRVSFGRCLTIETCPGGLRIRLGRLFGLFQEPFLVPWRDIAVEPRRILIFSIARIRFARWPGGEMTMPAARWNRIAAAAAQAGLAVPE